MENENIKETNYRDHANYSLESIAKVRRFRNFHKQQAALKRYETKYESVRYQSARRRFFYFHADEPDCVINSFEEFWYFIKIQIERLNVYFHSSNFAR